MLLSSGGAQGLQCLLAVARPGWRRAFSRFHRRRARRLCPGLPHCPAVAPGPGPPGTKERSGGSVFHLKIDKGDFPAASVAVATAAQVTAAVQVQPLAGELLRASGVAAEKQEMKS